MPEFIICDSCGTKCEKTDTYCKKCSNTLPDWKELERPVIDGIDDEALEKYVEHNVDYYKEKFKKPTPKRFIQLNFAAWFIGPFWYFYRRMYKAAFIYLGVTVVLPLLLQIIFSFVFKSFVDEFFVTYDEVREAWKAYRAADANDELAYTQYTTIYDQFAALKQKIRWIEFPINAIPIISRIFFSLYANCFYKNHLIKNIGSTEGGTSVKSGMIAFWSSVGFTITISLLMLFIPAAFNFARATYMSGIFSGY